MNKKDKEDWVLTFKNVKELYSILSVDYVLDELIESNKSYDDYGWKGFNEKDIKIIKLHWQKFQSFDKIAEELNISRHVVRDRYSRIINRMQKNIRRSIYRLQELSKIKEELEEVKRENEALQERFNSLSEEEKKSFGNPEYVKLRIIDIDLSLRTLNGLMDFQIRTVGDLLEYKKSDLLRLRNFGKKSLNEVEEKILKPLGLELKE